MEWGSGSKCCPNAHKKLSVLPFNVGSSCWGEEILGATEPGTGNMYAPWVFVDKQMLLTLIFDNTAIWILYTAGSGQICTNWTEKNLPWTFPEIDGKQTNKAVCHAGFSTISLEKAWENNRMTIEFLNWHSRIYIYISGPFWTSTHCSKEYGCQVCSLCRGRLQAMFYHTIHVSHGTGLPSAASVSQA